MVIKKETTNFTWFTPTLGLRPPKIVQTKPSGFFYFYLSLQTRLQNCSSNTAISQQNLSHIENEPYLANSPYHEAIFETSKATNITSWGFSR